jgi:Flp pilus assembly protein TadD
MPLRKTYLATVVLALTSTICLAGDSQWIEVRSPNFSVLTDAGERRGRDVALHFEQMRGVYGTLLSRSNVNLPVPLQIVAFRNSKEIRAMAPMFNGKPTEVAGLFQSGNDRSFIMLDMSVENPWAVVFHEYAHQLMNGNLSARTDPWFEEGFAEFFSSIEVDNKEARVGKIPEDTYRILQQMGMMKIADLFRVHQYSKTYNETGSHRTVFYAESSLLVHYIYDKNLMLKAGDYFSAAIDQKKPVEQAIQQAFGMSADQFDKVLRNYLQSGRYMYYPIPTPAGIVASKFPVTPVGAADASALLADIDIHSLDHHERALGEFQAVLQMDPNNAAALRGMGYAYLQRQDFEHAREYFRQAAARDSKDARVHYYSALLMNRSPGSLQSGEIKKELEIAIGLDPKLADAYSLLGYAQAYSGEPEKGLVTMKKAVELSPRNETYQLNLANIYMVNKKVSEANALLRYLSQSGEPAVAQRAKIALEQAQIFNSPRSFQTRIVGEGEQPVAARNADPGSDTVKENETSEVKLTPSTPIRFIKGKIASMDCSAAPQAILSVTAGGRSLKLTIPDSKHLVLIGADELSCEWKNKSVAVNYHERSQDEGEVVSLEIQ